MPHRTPGKHLKPILCNSSPEPVHEAFLHVAQFVKLPYVIRPILVTKWGRVALRVSELGQINRWPVSFWWSRGDGPSFNVLNRRFARYPIYYLTYHLGIRLRLPEIDRNF